MKKVLVFGMTENSGGIETVIMNYYRNIDRSQLQFDFLCNTDSVAYEDEIISLGGNIFRVKPRRESRKDFKKEMTHFFSNNAKEYSAIWVNVCSLANIDYLKYAKKYGIKKRIIHAHNSQNMDSFLRGLLHRFNKLFIGKYATDFWSCSKEASKWFYNNSIMNGNNYLLINNAIDFNKYKFDLETRKKYREMLNIDEKTLVLVNVGRMHFQKNHPFILKVFNEVHKNILNSKLILIGDGPDREKIENLVKKYDLEDSVINLGIRNDVPQLMSAMDIFLFPSLFEGLPLVLIEAQASNLLIYASDVISNEVVIDNDLVNLTSLNEDEYYWAKQILRNVANNRESNKIENLLKEKNYDIKLETKKFQKMIEGEK